MQKKRSSIIIRLLWYMLYIYTKMRLQRSQNAKTWSIAEATENINFSYLSLFLCYTIPTYKNLAKRFHFNIIKRNSVAKEMLVFIPVYHIV